MARLCEGVCCNKSRDILFDPNCSKGNVLNLACLHYSMYSSAPHAFPLLRNTDGVIKVAVKKSGGEHIEGELFCFS